MATIVAEEFLQGYDTSDGQGYFTGDQGFSGDGCEGFEGDSSDDADGCEGTEEKVRKDFLACVLNELLQINDKLLKID